MDTPALDTSVTDNPEANVAVVREFFRRQLGGDIDGLITLLAPDCRSWTAGELGSSGWRDRGGYIAALRASGGGGSKLFVGPLEFHFGFVTAQDDRVCVEAEARADMINGKVYNNQYHFFFRVRNGLVFEVKEYFDSQHMVDVIPGVIVGRGRETNLSGATLGW